MASPDDWGPRALTIHKRVYPTRLVAAQRVIWWLRDMPAPPDNNATKTAPSNQIQGALTGPEWDDPDTLSAHVVVRDPRGPASVRFDARSGLELELARSMKQEDDARKKSPREGDAWARTQAVNAFDDGDGGDVINAAS